MTPFGWVLTGFVAGVGVASVAFWSMTSEPPRKVALPTQVLQPPASGTAAGEVIDLVEEGKPRRLNNDPLGELDVRARVAMMRWMAANPQYEFIARDYCDCRTMPETNCPPYEAERLRLENDYAYTDVRDFNKDGQLDFAIILALKGKEGPARLLLFNGPFGDDIPMPAFSATGLEHRDHVSNGYFGLPGSDNGYVFKVKGDTYELEYIGNPG